MTTGLQMRELDPKISDQVKEQLSADNFLIYSIENTGTLNVYFNARIKLLQFPLTNSAF